MTEDQQADHYNVVNRTGFHGDWVRWVPRSLVLLVLMFVSASMSPRLRVGEAGGSRSSLDHRSCGLSGSRSERLGRWRRGPAVDSEIDGDRRGATGCRPVCGPWRERRDRSVGRNRRGSGSVELLELDWWDVAERLVQRSWLNQATQATVASSTCARERHTRSEISSVL